MLYHRGLDSILHHFLTHEEDKVVLNEFHYGSCRGNLFRISTSQISLRMSYY